MPRPAIVPRLHERRFGIEELFFSTTDRKGIIVTGNRVFSRVSGWSAAELSGEPHNILRHPDMPRVVFRLLWDEIEAGRPIVAYVKNLARDGGFYWVIASVVPIPGGYLSVRFKPSSPIFPVVRDLYARLLAAERSIEEAGGPRDAAMAASGAALHAALQELGYEGYQAFMQAFVPVELKSRDAAMSAPTSGPTGRESQVDSPVRALRADVARLDGFLSGEFAHLDAFVKMSGSLARKSAFVTTLASDVRLTSQNVSISARRLETGGGPLGVVGSAIQDLADSGTTVSRSLSVHTDSLSAALRDLSLRIAMARLQAQCAAAFVAELEEPAPDAGGPTVVGPTCQSIAALSACLAAGLQRVFDAYVAIEEGLRQASDDAAQLTALLRTLDMARLTGTVEIARLDAPEFAQLFQRVGTELDQAGTEMREFGQVVDALRTAAGRVAAQRADVLACVKRIEAASHALGTDGP